MFNASRLRLSLVALFTATGCSSLCDVFPTDPQCQISLQAIPEISRQVDRKTAVTILPERAIQPALKLSFDPTFTQLIHYDINETAKDIVTAKVFSQLLISFSLADVAQVPKGSVVLHAGLGSRTDKTCTWLFTPPSWPSMQAVVTYLAPDKPESAFIAKRPQDSAASLFVGETVKNGTLRQLARFDVVATGNVGNPIRLMRDTAFEKVAQTPSTSAIYAPSQNEVLVYRTVPSMMTMVGEVDVMQLSDGQVIFQQPVALQTLPRLSAELDGPLRVLVNGNTTLPLAFNLGIGKPFNQITIPPVISVHWLAASEQVLPMGRRLSAVVAIGNNGLASFLSQTADGTALTLNSGLADEALKADSQGLFKDASLAGIAVSDIDQDGYPDLVTTWVNPETMTTQLAWLPRRPLGCVADGLPAAFTTWHYVDLPAAPSPVSSLALGDLDGNGSLDVVLVGQSSVVCYRNQAQ